jgi:hypothetical protein
MKFTIDDRNSLTFFGEIRMGLPFFLSPFLKSKKLNSHRILCKNRYHLYESLLFNYSVILKYHYSRTIKMSNIQVSP